MMKIKQEDLKDDGRWQYDEDLGPVRSGPRGNRYWDEFNQNDTDILASLNTIARLNTGIDPGAESDRQRTQSRQQNASDFANNPYIDPRRPTQEERLRYRRSDGVRSRAWETYGHSQASTSINSRRDISSQKDVGSKPSLSEQSPPEKVISNARKSSSTSPDFFELPAPTPEPQGRPRSSVSPQFDPPIPNGRPQEPPVPVPPPPPAGCICPIHLDCDARDASHLDCRQLVPLYKRWQAAQAQLNPWPYVQIRANFETMLIDSIVYHKTTKSSSSPHEHRSWKSSNCL
jgi:hypothetical protein